MPTQFNHLPIVLLEDIFKLLDPEGLFDLRFLNKYLFNIVNNVIKYNLSYSIYYYRGGIQYRVHQKKFIEKNGEIMKHIYLEDDNLELLNNYPNIISLEIYVYDEGQDSEGIDQDIEFSIKTDLIKLKKLAICRSNIIGYLKLFKNYLNQIETIELTEPNEKYGFKTSINDIVKYLNPNKLKSLTLDIEGLNLDGLDIIKTKFINLKELNLIYCDFTNTSINLNPNLNFIPHLKLKIHGYFWDGLDIEFLGDLNCLKRIELRDNSNYLFDMCSNTKLIGKDNLFISGRSDFNKPIDHYLKKLAYSKQLYVYDLSTGLSNVLTLLPNIHHLFIYYLPTFCNRPFEKFDINEIGEYKVEFIKQITVNQLNLYLDDFLSFLSLFPNLEVIKIKYFNLKIREPTVTYNPPTSLLLIASIPSNGNPELYQKLDQLFKMNWAKF